MEYAWIGLGIAIGAFISALIYVSTRPKHEHDWVFVEQLKYYEEIDELPVMVKDQYQCSQCREYKLIKAT